MKALLDLSQIKVSQLLNRLLISEETQTIEGDVIDPEQLAYLGFIIGGSQASERLDLEVWVLLRPA